jgi:O-acetyl-ADP-ribose deacetylase (regulator of RNase III)
VSVKAALLTLLETAPHLEVAAPSAGTRILGFPAGSYRVVVSKAGKDADAPSIDYICETAAEAVDKFLAESGEQASWLRILHLD